MTSRGMWLIGAAAAVLSIAGAASLPVTVQIPRPLNLTRALPVQQQLQEPPPRQESSSRSVGPVFGSESVIASWQSHGADDGPIDASLRTSPAPPVDAPVLRGGRNVAPPPGVDPQAAVNPLLNHDWMLDLMVLWRWRGPAPEMTQPTRGGDWRPGFAPIAHVIVVEGRELRVDHDPKAGTARVDGVLVPLNGANVVMLDVEDAGVRVAGLATVEPRYPQRIADQVADPVEIVKMRAPDVAAFLTGAR